MKSSYIHILIFSLFGLSSCISPSSQVTHENLKSELFAVEKEFCDMAQREGVEKAFVYFAADSSVILRGEQLIKGKEAILRKYSIFPTKGVKLVWTPDFADVALSGDLGYTYGKYTYTATDSLGVNHESNGVFHTVWKRQANGSWKFVWD